MRKVVLITSVSSKGQVVIPNEFRKELGLEAGKKLAVFSDGANLLFKPIEAPKKEIFDKLIRESRKIAKETGLKKSHVAKAIQRVRNASRY
ncbi:MAG: AbrB/MazE/SpoVT family DNA-binding domain-containing protein [Bdellovibrio sp.]|nr:AbrB/MazE/SpoVT family DNA-binding domain-containing protein [Bdellovibrio sp.]